MPVQAHSFSVPQQCSSSTHLKWPWQDQIDMKQSSSKDGMYILSFPREKGNENTESDKKHLHKKLIE